MKAVSLLFIVLMLNGIIAIHECGHLFAAKLFGIAAPRFVVGLGPQLLSTTYGSTTYSLGMIPLGGYVEIAGMSSKQEITIPKEQLFSSKPYWQKALVIVAGIISNIILAFLLFFIGATVALQDQGARLLHTIYSGLIFSCTAIINGCGAFFSWLKRPGRLQGVEGPLSIVQGMHSSLQTGTTTLLFAVGSISLQVALFNLLPLPILDGGRLVIVTLESMYGKPFSPTMIGVITLASLVFLIMLVIYLTLRDARRLRSAR